MKKRNILTAIAVATVMMSSCSSNVKKQVEAQVMETHVLHSEDVDSLTPDSVIAILIEGNNKFVAKNITQRDVLEQIKESDADGQHPLAIVLSCIDSRVPVEYIFDKGAGDIFVARQAGNVIDADILGSMEYACEHSGSKVVLILGHEHCGAVHAAVEHVQAGNMTQMLAKIEPAINECTTDTTDIHSEEFLSQVTRKNVENMIEQVRLGSPMLNELEESGKIKIVGGIFNLRTGKVELI